MDASVSEALVLLRQALTDEDTAVGFDLTGTDLEGSMRTVMTMRDGLIIKPVKAEEQTEATLPAARQP